MKLKYLSALITLFVMACNGVNNESADTTDSKQFLTEQSGESGSQLVLPDTLPPSATPLMFKETGVRATGNEPFWMVEVRKDSFIFDRLGFTQYRTAIPEPYLNLPDSLKYLVEFTDGNSIDVLFLNQPCVDDMSGYGSPFTTVLKYKEDGEEMIFHGCADYLSEFGKIREVME